jgi:hypothetical protein
MSVLLRGEKCLIVDAIEVVDPEIFKAGDRVRVIVEKIESSSGVDD